MELFTTSFQSNIYSASEFISFMENNNAKLNDIINTIQTQEKIYGTSPSHKDLILFEAVLFYKIILPYIYQTLGLTWNNNILFTDSEVKQIYTLLKLKSYTI